MKKMEFISASALGLIFAFGVSANNNQPKEKDFDISSIVILEEEAEIDLGFDTADYLPEDFNPYAYPQDVDGFNYIDENDTFELGFDPQEHLPEGFDPYIKIAE